MKIVKKIIFCFFVVFNVTAMDNKRKLPTPNPSATYYQNVEDAQHGDIGNNGFKKSKTDTTSSNVCTISFTNNSKTKRHTSNN